VTRLRFIVAIAIVIAGAEAPASMAPASVADADLLYVCIQDDAKIAVVDMGARTVQRIVDLTTIGFPATAKPHYIQVEPDGSFWYASLIGAGRVVKFDRQNVVAGQFEMETPGMMSIVPGSSGSGRLVVTRSMSAVNPPKRIALVDRKTMKGEEIDVLFARPHPMAATRAYAYTGSLGVNQLASIALDTGRVEIVPVGPANGPTHSLVQFALAPRGAMLVASTDVSGDLLVFDLADAARPKLVKTVEVGKMAFDPTFTADGRFVWLPVKSTNEIAIVDTTSWTVTSRIKDSAFKQPHQIVLSSDGSTAFVTNNNKVDHMADPAMAGHAMPGDGGAASLVVIDVKTQKVVKSIELGKNLTGMGTRSR
jgi:DNA-binding beta-propeller fold protein YncE